MKTCILCGKLTEGSVGAAGLKWSMICQKCKDEEDAFLLESLKSVAIPDIYETMEQEFKNTFIN